MNTPTFATITRTTRYTAAGAVKSTEDVVHFTTIHLRSAFIKAKSLGRQSWPSSDCLVRHLVRDEAGEEVFLIRLYEEEVGPDVFAAQLADETFSINLDEWLLSTSPELVAYLKTKDAA